MRTSPYQLAMDVFLCLSGNHFVFLDLRRDQYLCLNRRNTQIAMNVFTGFVENNPNVLKGERSGEILRVVQALTDKGLLAQEDEIGNGYTPVSVREPQNAFLPPGGSQNNVIRTSHWAAFLQASLKASAKLRWFSMRRTVRSIANRKQRCARSKPEGCDILVELVSTFHRLRPFYMREYLCLYDSLALIEFLAQYRYFPQWIFGVRTEPFNAHCWIQKDDHVLNDVVENVRDYTPIMVV